MMERTTLEVKQMASQVTHQNADEICWGEYATDASVLGIAPGESFPFRLETTMGNGQPFLLKKKLENNAGAVYGQGNGCLNLTVYNT
jgi:hypothetical protein